MRLPVAPSSRRDQHTEPQPPRGSWAACGRGASGLGRRLQVDKRRGCGLLHQGAWAWAAPHAATAPSFWGPRGGRRACRGQSGRGRPAGPVPPCATQHTQATAMRFPPGPSSLTCEVGRVQPSLTQAGVLRGQGRGCTRPQRPCRPDRSVLTPAGEARVRHLATRALRGARAAAGARPHACPVQTWAAPVPLPCLPALKSPLECSLKRRPRQPHPAPNGAPPSWSGEGSAGSRWTPPPSPLQTTTCATLWLLGLCCVAPRVWPLSTDPACAAPARRGLRCPWRTWKGTIR